MSEGVLLDTCIVVDHLAGRLDVAILERINEQPRRFVSVVTAWEIELKPKLRNSLSQEQLSAACQALGARILPVTMDDVSSLRHLHRFKEHKDPFDRLLVAQAVSHNLAMSTYDSQFSLYLNLELI